jgi:general secretion pathway protein A
MYVQYFGLKESPFALPPDPRYLYLSQRHQEALAHLMYGITGGGGFVQLTGEVGTGKTMMARTLLDRLPDNVDVALVLYPFLSVREFMISILDDLHIQHAADGSLKALIDTLNVFLLENHARGRRTVLIVDEAHKLNHELLEQIRLLTNLETTKEKLLQIILVGQPELARMLAHPNMRQLAQRVSARYNLKALKLRETGEYVLHRLRVASAVMSLFTRFALLRVHRITGGVPRLINILCDRALLAAYTRGQPRVDVLTVWRAAREIESGERATLPRRAMLAGALVGVLGLAVMALALWFHYGSLAPEADTARSEAAGVAPVVEAAAATSAEAGRKVAAAKTAAIRVGTPTTEHEPRLEQVLADPVLPTDTDAAFSGLFAHWQLDYTAFRGATACVRANRAGLKCLFEAGTWNNLRQLNRPAIVELVDAQGTRHHVLVAALTEENVSLEFAGRRYRFPLTEVNRFWFGKFLTLWRPPEVGDHPIRRGMRGPPVAWVRDALARYGLPRSLSPASDVFDTDLESRVREFQRRHQIEDDGVVGKQTLIYLSAHDVSKPPLLSGPVETLSR